MMSREPPRAGRIRRYVFREPRRGLTTWLALVSGGALLLLSWPYLGWQWATGTPGSLLGLGCVSLGAAKLMPGSDISIVVAGCLRVAGYLLFVFMVIYVVSTVLP